MASRNVFRTAGGGISPEPDLFVVGAAGADVVEPSGGRDAGRDAGRMEISLAGVLAFEAVGTLLEPLVINVNSAKSPLLS